MISRRSTKRARSKIFQWIRSRRNGVFESLPGGTSRLSPRDRSRLKIAGILLESDTPFSGDPLRFQPAAEIDPVGTPPALLISVRNADEARSALEGGCAILDVKEPARGALGMASVEAIAAIVACRNQHAPGIPVSIALGDLVDWEGTGTSVSCEIGGPLLSKIEFVKLGTAGVGNDPRWSARFERICRPETPPGGMATPRWVAVAYADWNSANAPAPREVITTAAKSGCRGILIDTSTKTGAGLFDCLTIAELKDLEALARRNNLWFALAGGLCPGDLPLVREIAPAIVGIRSAACHAGRRDGAIDPAAIRVFQQALTETFAMRPASS